ncbi:MAG: hypothetical protein SVW57_11430 [Thermodesulfobacteriota bacterium]|nr:hypothetical protein [Thermodesulfobacteriota bacterium]
MKSYEVMFWSGLISWIVACIGLSAIGLRNSTWFGMHRSLLSALKPVDIKIAKGSALFFLVGLLFFGLGFWLK